MAGFTVTARANANLKTGYLVRAEVVEASVAASCKVGDIVKISYEGTSSAVITPITSTSGSTSGSYPANASTQISAAISGAKAAVSAGQLIIAQADQTMLASEHIMVENRDYRYDPTVKSDSSVKKVAVYRIHDISNINVNAVATGVNS